MIKSRRFRWAGHIARIEESRTAFKILTDTPAVRRPLRRPRLKKNIKVYLKEICVNTGYWVDSNEDRDYWRALVNATLNLRVP